MRIIKPHLIGAVFLPILFFSSFCQPAAAAQVSGTAYNATVAQTGHRNGPSASGVHPLPGIMIAVLPRLRHEYPLWTVVRLNYSTVKHQPRKCGLKYVKKYLPYPYGIILDFKAVNAKGKFDFLMPKSALVKLPNGEKINPSHAFGRCKGITVTPVMRLKNRNPASVPKTENLLVALVQQHKLQAELQNEISMYFRRGALGASISLFLLLIADALACANMCAWTRAQ